MCPSNIPVPTLNFNTLNYNMTYSQVQGQFFHSSTILKLVAKIVIMFYQSKYVYLYDWA